MRTRSSLVIALGLVFVTGLPQLASAATQTWGNSGGTNFNAGASWLSGTAPTAGDIAAFNAGAVAQPSLTSSLSIGQLYFNTTTASGYTLSSTGTAVKLTLTSVGSSQATAAIGAANTSGTNTISSGIVFGAASGATQYINQSTGGTLALTGVIESTNLINLNFNSPGTYLLNGANIYSGTTTISWTSSGGNLRLGNKNALGTSTLHTSNNNALISASTDLTGANKIMNNLSFGSNVQIGAGQALEFGGNVNLNGQNRNITLQPGSITNFSGVISNDGGQGLTLIASGAVTLSGSNTFSGVFQFRGAEPVIVSVLNNAGTAGNVGAGSVIRFASTNVTASNMRYVGSGETTNRTIDLGGTISPSSLAHEGTGLLHFTSDLTVTGTGNKTFTLTGSSVGTGEISGRIPDGPAGSVITIAKAGTSQWTLSGSNSYTGGTLLSAGSLGLGHKNALGTGTLTFGTTAATSLFASTALTGVNAVANTVSLNSSGAMTISGTNALQLSGTVLGSQAATARTLTVSNTALTTMSGPVFLANGAFNGSGLIINGGGNLTISGNVSDNVSTGTGSTLTYSGSGVLRLDGSNSYRGLTTVNGQGGTLMLGSSSALGASSGVAVSATGATLDLNGQNYTTAISVTSLQGRLTNSSTTAAVYAGDVSTTSTAIIDGIGNITLNGNTTGNTQFVKSGTNTLTLGGTAINTSLSLTLNQGTVVLNKTSTTAIRNGVIINGGLLQLAGTGGNQILNNAGSPGVIINGGTFDVNTRDETVTSLQLGGTGAGTITGSTGVLSVLNTIDARNGSSSAILSGTAGLTKTTTGTVTLSAVNTYTGATTISEGTLLLAAAANNIANSSVINVASGATLDVSGVSGFTLANGQTLQGVGTVEGALTVGNGSTLAIGNSPGTMTFADGLALTTGGLGVFEINGFTTGLYDLAQDGSGLQAVAFGGTLNLVFQAGFNTLGTVKIFDFGSYSGNFDTVNTSGLDSGYSANFNALTGEVSVVPEPSTWALLGLGFGALIVRARSRRRSA